jgi:hypothetical protein
MYIERAWHGIADIYLVCQGHESGRHGVNVGTEVVRDILVLSVAIAELDLAVMSL